MKQVVDEKFTTIKVTHEFAHWLKVEAAKAGVTMYEFIESRFPGAPKKRAAKR